MKTEITNYFSSLKLGDPQTYKHIIIIPLLGHDNGGPIYVTLDEALADKKLTVTETTESGSVPELKVTNAGDQSVLLLDGEEVLGAKQNRVLNTSILIPAKAGLAIPVSCTEAGRWHYTSKEFTGSDAFLAQKIRYRKARSVSRSLEESAAYDSDQGEVWHHIAALHEKAHFHSPTHAMSDLFKAREEDLRHCLEAFPVVPGQSGLVVLINGEVAGLDTLSRSQAYARLHPKLVRSYVLDALLDQDQQPPAHRSPQDEGGPTAKGQPASVSETTAGGSPAHRSPQDEGGPTHDPLSQAKAFLDAIQTCEVKPFQSVGFGQDCRLSGPKTLGTALVHDHSVIHAALFRADPADQERPISPMHRRLRPLE